jgi:hypothetical protein
MCSVAERVVVQWKLCITASTSRNGSCRTLEAAVGSCRAQACHGNQLLHSAQWGFATIESDSAVNLQYVTTTMPAQLLTSETVADAIGRSTFANVITVHTTPAATSGRSPRASNYTKLGRPTVASLNYCHASQHLASLYCLLRAAHHHHHQPPYRLTASHC